MKLLGKQVESCDAVMQVITEHGKWLDYCTIKDEGDCRQAERLIDDPQYRILMLGYYEGVRCHWLYCSGRWEVVEYDLRTKEWKAAT